MYGVPDMGGSGGHGINKVSSTAFEKICLTGRVNERERLLDAPLCDYMISLSIFRM